MVENSARMVQEDREDAASSPSTFEETSARIVLMRLRVSVSTWAEEGGMGYHGQHIAGMLQHVAVAIESPHTFADVRRQQQARERAGRESPHTCSRWAACEALRLCTS